MNSPLVSIIIPTYNCAHLIEETLESIITQTYKNWECIVVDDGSTDHSEVVFKDYELKDKRFRFFSRPKTKPKGANACRNIGIEKAKSNYIIFLDADDLLAKNCLEKRVSYFKKNLQQDFLIFNMGQYNDNLYFEKKKPIPIDKDQLINLFLRRKYPWNVTSPIWKKSFLLQLGKFDEKLQRLQDVDIHLKALLQPNVSYLIIHHTDSYYRVNSNTILKYKDLDFKIKVAKSYVKYLQNLFNNLSEYQKVYFSNSIKYGYLKYLSKFLERKNSTFYKESYSCLKKNLPFTTSENIKFSLLRHLILHQNNKKGFHYLRKYLVNNLEKKYKFE